MNGNRKRYGLAVAVWHFIDRAIYAIEDEPDYCAALSMIDELYYPLTVIEETDLKNEKSVIHAIRGIVSKVKHIIEHEGITVNDKNRSVDYLLAAAGLATLLAENIRDGLWK